MGYQSEAELENLLLANLNSKHKYEEIEIQDEKHLEMNFRKQLDKLNKDNLSNKTMSDKEFERVLIYMKGKSIYQSAKQLRDKYQLPRDDGSFIYLTLIDFDNINKNTFQVSNQITMRGKYENRYDVTVLINGIPVVQMELKRRGIHIKEAFNQVCRYARHSYKGLFNYLQILVISNGVDTKYFANSDKPYRYALTFFWTDEENKRITNLKDFSDAFMNQRHLMKMMDTYTAINDTDKEMMVLRPYQVYAVKQVVKTAKGTANGGFVYHSTGSGKSLSSFKASQILAKEPSIKKVIFLVDRNDLDTQTVQEFNKFEQGSVDTTDSTNVLVKQMKDVGNTFIVTTVQKLSNAVKNNRYKKVMEQYENEKIIIIVDECHRSQFGEMHTRIKRFFKRAQFFGFTGTPRFKENKSQDGRTTADIFGRMLHTYMLKDAISDNNVLGFSVEYMKSFHGNYDEDDKEKVLNINTKEVYEDPRRIALIANHIANHHKIKTLNKKYNAMFATQNIETLIKYYNEFKSIDHDLRIAAIFSFQANESLDGKAEHSRESLDSIISDYNETFGTNFSSNTFNAYRTDISRRVKSGEIDLVIVVNIFLTGFDSKKTNSIFIDKGLRHHDLLQAFSRTNRVYESTKVWGNIICYRNLKDEVDEAVKMFNRSEGVDGVLQASYESYIESFRDKLKKLLEVTKTPADVDDLKIESKQKEFILEFKGMSQDLLALRTFVDFEFTEEIAGISEQKYEDFKSKYLLLHEQHQRESAQGKISILDEIDFAIELIQTDRINFEYIFNLIRNIERKDRETQKKDVKYIINELDRTDNQKLKRKVDLIKAFLLSELPNLKDDDSVDDAYNSFEDIERDKEITKFAEEYGIDKELIKDEISEFEFTGLTDKEKLIKKIKKPLIQRTTLVGKIIDFINKNVLKYE